MYAMGYVTLQLEDTIRQTHVNEVMNTEDRTAYAFGTIDFGDREKLVAKVTITDSNGKIVSDRTEEGSETEAL